MMVKHLFLVLIAALALITHQHAAAQEIPPKDDWVGKLVFVKSDAVAKVGDTVIDLELVDFPAEVKEVKGEWLWLGNAWVLQSQCMFAEQAFEHYNDLVRRDPKSSTAYRRRAVCWLEKGDDKNAIKDFDESIRLDPKNARAYDERGMAKFEMVIGKVIGHAMKPAMEAVAGAITGALTGSFTAPSDSSDTDLSDLNEEEKKLLAEALRDFDSAINLDPKLVSAHVNRGMVRGEMNDMQGAIKDFNEAIRLKPQDVSVYAMRGAAKMESKDYEGAIRDFDVVIGKDGNDIVNLQDRASAKAKIEDFGGAVRDYDEVLRLLPEDANTHIERGGAKAAMRDFEGAMRDYDEAIRITGASPYASVNKALFLSTAPEEHVRKPDEALKLIEEVLTKQPNYGNALSVKACILAAKGKFEEAIELERSASKDKLWPKDKSSTGGTNSEERIAAWKEGKLWHP